jgi:hypothetical protein
MENDGIFVDTTTTTTTTTAFDETIAEAIDDPLFRVLDDSSIADTVAAHGLEEEQQQQQDETETETEDHDGSDGLSMNTLEPWPTQSGLNPRNSTLL